MPHCTKCGHFVDQTAPACPGCGALRGPIRGSEVSAKSRLVALLLCVFLGGLGIHRFYVGKIGTGIVWLLTLGCLGVGTLIDLILIAAGSFRDSDGLPIRIWETGG